MAIKWYICLHKVQVIRLLNHCTAFLFPSEPVEQIESRTTPFSCPRRYTTWSIYDPYYINPGKVQFVRRSIRKQKLSILYVYRTLRAGTQRLRGTSRTREGRTGREGNSSDGTGRPARARESSNRIFCRRLSELPPAAATIPLPARSRRQTRQRKLWRHDGGASGEPGRRKRRGRVGEAEGLHGLSGTDGPSAFSLEGLQCLSGMAYRAAC